MMAHAFNPSTWEAEQVGLREFTVGLVYIVGFRTAEATQRNSVSTNKNKTNQL